MMNDTTLTIFKILSLVPVGISLLASTLMIILTIYDKWKLSYKVTGILDKIIKIGVAISSLTLIFLVAIIIITTK